LYNNLGIYLIYETWTPKDDVLGLPVLVVGAIGGGVIGNKLAASLSEKA
jgi:hypothetical protein